MNDLKLLRELIDNSGYKKCYIAQELGITRAAMANKLNGKTNITVTEMNILIRLLNLSAEDILKIFCTTV